MSWKGEFYLPIPADFSAGSVNFALDISRENSLGRLLKIDYDHATNKWSLVCENGKVTSDGTR